MEKQTVFLKRCPSKGELPKRSGVFIVKTTLGITRTSTYNVDIGCFICGLIGGDVKEDNIDYWPQEIELPSEDYLTTNVALHNKIMYHDMSLQESWNKGVKMCYNFILNKLKGG